MHSGVLLGFEGIHQLFFLTVLYFLHLYFKTDFITAEKYFFLITGFNNL